MDAVVGVFWCCLVYVYVEEDEQSPGGIKHRYSCLGPWEASWIGGTE